ncbi:MAG: hypothetical protein AAGC55_34330, partial [Myxococcota bacterium]
MPGGHPGRAGHGRQHSNRGARPPRSPGRVALGVLKWASVGGLAAFAIAAATVALMFWTYGRDPQLPNIRSAGDYEPVQVTRI